MRPIVMELLMIGTMNGECWDRHEHHEGVRWNFLHISIMSNAMFLSKFN